MLKKIKLQMLKHAGAASTFFNHIFNFPTPKNLNYLWTFGFLAFVCLVMQMVSGLFLTMFYDPGVNVAFDSVESIMRDVNYGWFMRYTHSNGASAFFAMIYVHIGKALYYKSYTSKGLWYSGLLIYLLMMAAAFTGYVLPWGQMSFWAATVITNFVSAIPLIGSDITEWVWGGFAVDGPTLSSFYTLHFFVPFLMLMMSIMHFMALHSEGSSTPLGTEPTEYVPFFPYFMMKYFFALAVFLFVFSYFVFFSPNALGHPENYMQANPLVTPAHIVPEWYFLPFYAMLSAVPDKALGVLCMLGSIVILFMFPLFDSPLVRSPKFLYMHKFLFWFFVFDFVFLGWLGSKPAEEPFMMLSQFGTVFYFVYFFTMPLVSKFEHYIWFGAKDKASK